MEPKSTVEVSGLLLFHHLCHLNETASAIIRLWNILNLGATKKMMISLPFLFAPTPILVLEFIWKTEINHITTKQVLQINSSFYQFFVILNILKKTSI